MELVGLTIILGIGTVIAIFEFFVIRGCLRVNKSSTEQKCLTGREIEEMRRKLASVGLQSITIGDVFNLIKTIRDTNLGKYTDQDPYIPADPYEDVDEK